MEFFDVVKIRQSVRSYSSRLVEPEKLQQILGAVNRAPSAGNLQAYEVYLVCDTNRKAALITAAWDQEFVAQAPVVLVFCAHAGLSAAKYEERGVQLYCIQDATIACTFAMLAAAALELATVWVGAFDEDAVRSAIGAPQAHHPVAILPIGYAAETPRNTPRRASSDIVHQLN